MNFPIVWRWKIGITGHLKKRTKQTSADVFGWYIPVAFVWTPYAWSIEQFLLNSTRKLKRQIFGRGGKEIRPWYIGIIAALIVYTIGLVKWSLPFWVALFLSWFAVHHLQPSRYALLNKKCYYITSQPKQKSKPKEYYG